MAGSLQGTTVLVTGAAGGLGKAIATAYLEAGANVAICDINEERLSQARADLAPKGPFLAVTTDVTDETAVAALVDDVVARFGRLDVLVSNAGMADKFDPVGSLSKEHWDRVIGLNLTGSFLAFRAAVNAMEKQSPPGGTIIQIGSAASTHGMASGVAYTVSFQTPQPWGLVPASSTLFWAIVTLPPEGGIACCSVRLDTSVGRAVLIITSPP